MSKSSSGSRDGLSEAFQDFLTNVARGLLGLGALVTLVATGLLIYTCVRVGSDPNVATAAMKNVAVFKQVMTFGSIGLAVGAAYMTWGDERGALGMLAVAALLFFAPVWVPMIAGTNANDVTAAALGAIQNGGGIVGVVGMITLFVDLVAKTRQRIKVGVKADQLKYGKGVKEEKDRQNVFMGKCFQLPYCRKFVRERCPIYHARRTCWRERVGCMCEEEVIRQAMEGKPIPKDQILDGSNIPRNHRLTPKAKAERCRNCVIYNEHQRHKYKAAVPLVVVSFVLLYGLGHGPLELMVENWVRVVDKLVHQSAMLQGQADIPAFVPEGLLFIGMLLLLTYTMKFVEFAVFKLKI